MVTQVDERTWIATTAISSIRSMDECAKTLIASGDAHAAFWFRRAAKAAEEALEALKEGSKDETR